MNATQIRKAFYLIERLRYGGYEVVVAGKKIIVRKMKDHEQEKGLYRWIVGDGFDSEMDFAIKAWFKIEKRREEDDRQQKERLEREARIEEKSDSITDALRNIQERQVSPNQEDAPQVSKSDNGREGIEERSPGLCEHPEDQLW